MSRPPKDTSPTPQQEPDEKPAVEDGNTEADVPEAGQDSPLLDLTDAAVKRMIKTAKARGYVTLDELNAVLPSDEVTSDQIEDIYGMLAEMGITVVESEEETENVVAKVEEESGSTEIMKVDAPKLPADRTDDPVRMYLREMGAVELLSRSASKLAAKP
jgi:RNA polymerase primary sigma factor